MSHKFSQLISLRKVLGDLSKTSLLAWVEALLYEENGEKTIVGGVFRELYAQGDNNSD